MCYLIQYNYLGNEAAKSFHFVEAENSQQALEKAKSYITRLLHIRFEKEISFTIENISEIRS